MCGDDDDLIMLGIEKNQKNFNILTHQLKNNKKKKCEICGKIGNEMKECIGVDREMYGKNDEVENEFDEEVELIFVSIKIIREYIEKELEMKKINLEYDFEREIDEWVFMCLFVGNDLINNLK
jgi:5'-3' exoribonuclease 2